MNCYYCGQFIVSEFSYEKEDGKIITANEIFAKHQKECDIHLSCAKFGTICQKGFDVLIDALGKSMAKHIDILLSSSDKILVDNLNNFLKDWNELIEKEKLFKEK